MSGISNLLRFVKKKKGKGTKKKLRISEVAQTGSRAVVTESGSDAPRVGSKRSRDSAARTGSRAVAGAGSRSRSRSGSVSAHRAGSKRPRDLGPGPKSTWFSGSGATPASVIKGLINERDNDPKSCAVFNCLFYKIQFGSGCRLDYLPHTVDEAAKATGDLSLKQWTEYSIKAYHPLTSWTVLSSKDDSSLLVAGDIYGSDLQSFPPIPARSASWKVVIAQQNIYAIGLAVNNDDEAGVETFNIFRFQHTVGDSAWHLLLSEPPVGRKKLCHPVSVGGERIVWTNDQNVLEVFNTGNSNLITSKTVVGGLVNGQIGGEVRLLTHNSTDIFALWFPTEGETKMRLYEVSPLMQVKRVHQNDLPIDHNLCFIENMAGHTIKVSPNAGKTISRNIFVIRRGSMHVTVFELNPNNPPKVLTQLSSCPNASYCRCDFEVVTASADIGRRPPPGEEEPLSDPEYHVPC